MQKRHLYLQIEPDSSLYKRIGTFKATTTVEAAVAAERAGLIRLERDEAGQYLVLTPEGNPLTAGLELASEVVEENKN